MHQFDGAGRGNYLRPESVRKHSGCEPMITVSMSDVNVGETLAAFLHPITYRTDLPGSEWRIDQHGVIVTMNQCGRLWGPHVTITVRHSFSDILRDGIADEHVVPKSRSHIYFP
jgi:hypothetical protein